MCGLVIVMLFMTNYDINSITAIVTVSEFMGLVLLNLWCPEIYEAALFTVNSVGLTLHVKRFNKDLLCNLACTVCKYEHLVLEDGFCTHLKRPLTLMSNTTAWDLL